MRRDPLDSSLPRSDRKLIVKIEQLHEKLLNILPLYGKIALALIPSLRNSVDFVNYCSRIGDDKYSSPKENYSDIDDKCADSNGEVDVALPLGEKGGLSNFLNTLTTALFYAGSEPIKSVRNILSDRPNSPGTLHHLDDHPPKIKEYEKLHSEIDLNGAVFDEAYMKDLARNDEDNTKLVDQGVDRGGPSEHLKSCSGHDSPSFDSGSSLATHHSIPLKSEMTPWQKSVFEKLHFVSQNKKAFFESGAETNESDFVYDTLPWLIGKRLEKKFDILENDQLQGVFQSWIVRDVLILSYVYLTSESICFYSLLPGSLSEANDIKRDIKLYEGALGFKLGHYGDSYYNLVATHKYWAVLKPQNLIIYPSSNQLFFPVKVIDLRDALFCEILDFPNTTSPKGDNSDNRLPKILSFTLLRHLDSETSSLNEETNDLDTFQGGVWLRVVCSNKSYKFYTKTIFSASHWCNAITKEIFHLHNANSKGEVLLKIPLSQIIEFKRNYILAENEEASENMTDAPVTFTIKYNTQEGFKAKKTKLLDKEDRSDDTEGIVHFVLFEQGAAMQSAVSKLLKSIRGKQSKTKMQAKSDCKFFSTLRSQLERGVSIVDRVALFNEEILSSDEKERYLLKEGRYESRQWKKKGEEFKTKSLPSFSIADIDSDDEFEIDAAMDSLRWHFPKQFSILTLKSMNFYIFTEKKGAAEIRKHYENLMEGSIESHAKEKIAQTPHPSDLHLSETTKGKTERDSPHRDKIAQKSTIHGIKMEKGEDPTFIYSVADNPINAVEDEQNSINQTKELKKFRQLFLLGPESELIASFTAFLRRKIPVYGKLYIGNESLYFHSLLPGVSTKMILPIKKLEKLKCTTGSMIRSPGLRITILNGEVLILHFGSLKTRDTCKEMILTQMSNYRSRKAKKSDSHSKNDSAGGEPINLENLRHNSRELVDRAVRDARIRLLEDRVFTASGISFPLILAEDPIFFTEVRSSISYRFTLLTIGSRGDVQPYIALGKALMTEGHVVTIATHSEFRDWILSHDLKFKEIAGDPAELMSLMVEHGSMSVGFIRKAASKFRGWVSELLSTSWEACQDTDILIESPSAMGGLHIAEALGIPYIRAFTMPWTRTRAYPHAFVVPEQKRGGSYNLLTHVMFETVFWKGISGQVNKWRTETLGLKRTNLVKMQQTQIPFLYNVSPEVFPPSVDFPDWVKVTGYWFLDEGSQKYTPPEDLVRFINKARADDKKIVYVGFGSIVVSDSRKLTKAIVDSVLALGVRCILNKGWSDRLSKEESRAEIELSEEIFNISLIPHDWLFPQIDAAVHHGGSGTTGATLRSGLPAIIKPFFGDQFFYASRIEELGVGIALKKLNAKTFTNALKAITTNREFLKKAYEMSKSIKHENGVSEAIASIYSEIAYSKSLIDSIRLNNYFKSTNDDDSPAIAQGDGEFPGSDSSDEDLTTGKVTLGLVLDGKGAG